MAKEYKTKEEELKSPPITEKYKKVGDKFIVAVHDSCIAVDEHNQTYKISSVYGYDEDGFNHIYSSGIFTEGYKMVAELEKDGTVQVTEIIKDEGDTTAD